MFDDSYHANLRLNGSVVMDVGGEPILVDSVDEGMVAYLHGANLRQTGRCPLSSINPVPPRLGYWNSSSGAFFLKRVPKRRCWRQGLRQDNVLINGKPATIIQIVNALRQKEYPTVKQALRKVKGGFSCAVGKSFAIGVEGQLLFRGKGVGTISKDGVEWREEFSYLEELLKSQVRL